VLYFFLMFIELRREVAINFVDIGVIVDNWHGVIIITASWGSLFKLSFHNEKGISFWKKVKSHIQSLFFIFQLSFLLFFNRSSTSYTMSPCCHKIMRHIYTYISDSV
jgi:hypothetical protein